MQFDRPPHGPPMSARPFIWMQYQLAEARNKRRRTGFYLGDHHDRSHPDRLRARRAQRGRPMIRNLGLVLLALPLFLLLVVGVGLGAAGAVMHWSAMRGFDFIVLVFREPDAR